MKTSFYYLFWKILLKNFSKIQLYFLLLARHAGEDPEPNIKLEIRIGFPAEFRYALITRNRSALDFVITRKKLFSTRIYVLRVIASFENETKRNVITCNFQLKETGETTTQRVFPHLNPCFQVGFPAEFRYV